MLIGDKKERAGPSLQGHCLIVSYAAQKHLWDLDATTGAKPRYLLDDKRHVLNRIRRKDDINKDSNTGLKLDTGDPRCGDV